uniref:Uncharacterized protein n=1 Tax=Elaeophora elaphi TaxID=1147741 RepID=A0A0R3RJB5_9BILA
MTPDEESKKILQPLSPNVKRRRNEALKTVNSNSGARPGQLRSAQQVDNTTTPTSRSHGITKQRQLLSQSKTVQKGKCPLAVRPEKLKKEVSREFPGASNSKSVPQPVNSTRSEIAGLHSGLPTSSVAHSSVKIRKSGKPSTSMTIETHRAILKSEHKGRIYVGEKFLLLLEELLKEMRNSRSLHNFYFGKQKDDTLKLKRLTDAIRAFDVLTVVFGQQIQKCDEELHAALEQSRKYGILFAFQANFMKFTQL